MERRPLGQVDALWYGGWRARWLVLWEDKGASQVAVVILGSSVRFHDKNESGNNTTWRYRKMLPFWSVWIARCFNDVFWFWQNIFVSSDLFEIAVKIITLKHSVCKKGRLQCISLAREDTNPASNSGWAMLWWYLCWVSWPVRGRSAEKGACWFVSSCHGILHRTMCLKNFSLFLRLECNWGKSCFCEIWFLSDCVD